MIESNKSRLPINLESYTPRSIAEGTDLISEDQTQERPHNPSIGVSSIHLAREKSAPQYLRRLPDILTQDSKLEAPIDEAPLLRYPQTMLEKSQRPQINFNLSE